LGHQLALRERIFPAEAKKKNDTRFVPSCKLSRQTESAESNTPPWSCAKKVRFAPPGHAFSSKIAGPPLARVPPSKTKTVSPARFASGVECKLKFSSFFRRPFAVRPAWAAPATGSLWYHWVFPVSFRPPGRWRKLRGWPISGISVPCESW